MSLNDKVILVTGGTGSFGRKFTEWALCSSRPKKLIIFSRDELKQQEMRQRWPDVGDSPMRYFIGDIRDKERLYRAMVGVNIVVHTAALKQVPSCEYNPFEAVKTNILGAANVIDAAIDCGVKKVIAISTDKAVNPVNIYGATKLCAEKLFVHGNSYSKEGGARFSVCRYGNVVGSRGSVVPLFLEQSKNGSVTITDRRMTRFWLTLDQAVEFGVKCVDLMRGGEIFVPKIPSMRVIDVARAVVPNASIEYVGIRVGEKIHETLISEDEAQSACELDDMYIIRTPHSWSEMDGSIIGKALPCGFQYTSESNPDRLSLERLVEVLQQL